MYPKDPKDACTKQIHVVDHWFDTSKAVTPLRTCIYIHTCSINVYNIISGKFPLPVYLHVSSHCTTPLCCVVHVFESIHSLITSQTQPLSACTFLDALMNNVFFCALLGHLYIFEEQESFELSAVLLTDHRFLAQVVWISFPMLC